MKVSTCSALVISALLAWTSLAHAAQPSALEATKEVMTLFGKLNATPKSEEANALIYKKLDQSINFELITSKPLAKHKQSFTKIQLEKVKKQFAQAIREAAYPAAADFVRQSKLEYGESKNLGKDYASVALNAYEPEQDVDIALVFFWRWYQKQWRIVDLSIDDASLVHDYENQFSTIIKEHGAKGLIDRIQKRLDDMHKPKKGS